MSNERGSKMSETEQIKRVIIRTYEGDDGQDEQTSFATVEINESEVDLIVHPFTVDARTITLDAEQAWLLARELARSAAVIEAGS